MPIYRFRCQQCGEEFEDFRSLGSGEERGECLKCGSRNIERRERISAGCECGGGKESLPAHFSRGGCCGGEED